MKIETGCYSDKFAATDFVVSVATSVKAGVTVSHHWKTAAPEAALRDLWNGHEHGVLAQAGYVQFYRGSLDKKRVQLCKEFARILAQAKEKEALRIVLCCYEPNFNNGLPASATFCHRYSLKTWLGQNFKTWLEEQAAVQESKAAQELAALQAEQAQQAPKPKRGRKAVVAA